VEPIGIQKVEVAEQGGPDNGKREIPEHLINLFDKWEVDFIMNFL
jgi:hypothetical protein